MQLTKVMNRLGMAILAGMLSMFASSCSDSEEVAGDVLVGTGSLSGTVTDELDQPLAGVTVTDLSSEITTTTAADGTYTLSDITIHSEGQIVSFAKEEYATTSITLVPSKFTDGKAVANITMAFYEEDLPELLRGLTAKELRKAPRWYNNEYKGGRNADSYPMFDWACDYMGAFDTWTGDVEEQNEGSTLRIRNEESYQSNPADTVNFDTFVYGRKLITADNSKLTIQVRTHQSPCYWGVQIIDLTKASPEREYVGNIRVADNGSYYSEYFDLSPWEGKEVVVVIGHYRKETGDYWRQLVLRRIAFSNQYFGDDWLTWMPGTEVADLPDWHMTESMVRSSMPQDLNTMTGLSPVSGNRDNYIDAYRSWRDAGHVMAYWTLMPLYKDPDLFNAEGYMIKTRGGGAVNTLVPEQYVYAKYSIAPGHNKFKLTTRNFGDNYTYFKFTAITMDCKAHFIAPADNDAQEASAAEDGCWKFKSGDNYCTFTYDLSQFDGQDVMICLSVHNGEANGDENKLTLNTITIE